ncbi:MAG: protoporphyrinogen oxidase [Candidatus Hydrogenedens sp.]|nr:protoporphyrinogen oxidase [Candidatus Hydrogenedens sp.]
MAEEVKILVIGGGISGLCSAYYLSRFYRPQHVMLLEGASRLGGTCYSDRMNGFVCEWGPNGWLDKEPQTKQWLKDLKIDGQTVTANDAASKRFILRNNKLHEIKPPPAFLFTRALSLGGKLRMMQEPLRPRRKSTEPETVWDFAARRLGPEVADYLVTPMISGVFAGDPKKLSVEHAFPMLVEMEQKHGSLFNGMKAMAAEKKKAGPTGMTGKLTSFPNGMGTLIEAAGAALGDRVRLNEGVTRIERRDDRFLVTTAQGKEYRSQGLVLAIPSHAAGRMMADLDRRQGAALAEIPYAPITVFCTGFRREDIEHPLDGFGFLAPRNENVRALGCLWSSSIFPNRAPEGYVLLRTMYGGALDPKSSELSDRDLLNAFTRDMSGLLGIKKQPEFGRIYRHPRGIPQYDLKHGKHLEVLDYGERQFPGLVYAGNAYRGIALNDCVKAAHRTLKRMQECFPE